MAADANTIGVLVDFKANAGNLTGVLNTVKTQLNSLTLTNAKLAQATGQALPGMDQQVLLLRAMATQGNVTAQAMVNMAQSSKVFYSVFSGNVKQNLAVLFKSGMAVKQTKAAIASELGNLQLIGEKTFGSLTNFTNNWALKTRTMAAVTVESWHRVGAAMIATGKQMQWVGRQLMVGVTVPFIALTYVLGKAAYSLSVAQTELAKFLQGGDMTFTQITNTITNKLAPALRGLSEELGISQVETTDMAAKWVAAGYSATKLLLPVTKLTEELATLTQGDIDVAQAQEFVRTINATFYTQSAKGIEQTRKQLEALQVIQSTTSLQMRDIVESLPSVAAVGHQIGLNATELTAMIAGMRQLGTQATVGANAMKVSFARMISPTKEAADLFQKTFGRSIQSILYVQSGPRKGQPIGRAAFEEIAGMFAALQQKSPEAATQLAAKLFSSRQYVRMLQLFQSMTNSNSDYHKSLDETTNATKNQTFWNDQLKAVLGSLNKQWDIIKVKIGNVAASIGQDLLPAVQGAADAFVHMLQTIERVLKSSPQLIGVLAKIAGALAAIGPLIYAGGIFGKLLPGNIITGLTQVMRKVVGLQSIEAPNALAQLGAAAGAPLPLQIGAGLPRGGVGEMGIAEQMAARDTLAGSFLQPGGTKYPMRQIIAQMLASKQLGNLPVGDISKTTLQGVDEGTLVSILAGESVKKNKLGGVAKAIAEYNSKPLAPVLEQVVGQRDVMIAELVSEQQLLENSKGTLLIPGKVAGKANVIGAKTATESQISNLVAAKQLEHGLGVTTTQGVEQGIAKHPITNWFWQILSGTKQASLQEATVGGEQVGLSFSDSLNKKIKGMTSKGKFLEHPLQNFANLFRDLDKQVLTATPAGGFTTILLKFTSVLPELILLVGATIVVLKNWRSIWEGLKGPLQVVGQVISEIGQIWVKAFSGIVQVQQKGSEINQFWKNFGQTLGQIIIGFTIFARGVSNIIAPAIAGLVKILVVAGEAFFKIISIFTEGRQALIEFWKTGEGGIGIIGKIVAIVAVGYTLIKVFNLLKLAWIGFRVAVLEGNVAAAIEGVSAGFASLGTIGIVLVLGAIAAAFAAVGQAAAEAQRAVAESQASLVEFNSQFAAFLNASKGQSLDSFKSSANGIVDSMVAVIGKIATAQAQSGGWADATKGVNSALESMGPILQHLNTLSNKQLQTFKQLVDSKRQDLELTKILDEAQVASVQSQIQAATGLKLSVSQIGELVKLQKENQTSFGRTGFADSLVSGLDAHDALVAMDSLFTIIKANGTALDPVITDLNTVMAEILALSGVKAGLDFKKPTASLGSLQDKLDEAKNHVMQLGDSGKDAAKKLDDAFKSAYESQLAQTTDRVTSAILDSFDKQTAHMLDGIDKQIKALEKQNSKEEWLQQQREYRHEREKLLFDSEISMAIAAAERQKAINEGRIDDARIIELQALQAQHDNQKQINDLDKQHAKDVKDRETQRKIDQLNKEKDHLQKVRDVMRTRLANILSEITEFGARTKAEWLRMYQNLNSTAGQYGVTIQATAHNFFQAWGHTISADLSDAFHDAQIAAAREAQATGKAVVDGFQKGMSQSQGLKLISEANKLLDKISAMTSTFGHLAHGGDVSFSDLTGSKKYQNLVSQYDKIINQILSAHTGGMIESKTKRGDVPIMAQEGEFIVRRDAVKKIGVHNLHQLNKYHDGGMVDKKDKKSKYAARIPVNHHMLDEYHTGGFIPDQTRGYLAVASQSAINLMAGSMKNILAGGVDFLRGTAGQVYKAIGKTFPRATAATAAEAAPGTFQEPRGAPNSAGAKSYYLTYPRMEQPPSGAIASTSGTANAKNFMSKASQAFPTYNLHYGVYNRRSIKGSSTWSQHSWGNAVDTMITDLVQTTKPWNMKKMDIVAAWTAKNFNPLNIATQIWRHADHYNHQHTDFWPQGTGTPPVLHGGGLIKRTMSKLHKNPRNVPIVAEEGEFVVNRHAVKKPGILDKLHKLNKHHYGGTVRSNALSVSAHVQPLQTVHKFHRGGEVGHNALSVPERVNPLKTVNKFHSGGFVKPNFNFNPNFRFITPPRLRIGGMTPLTNPQVARGHNHDVGNITYLVEIEQFFGDDNSYRKLYQTLERVGNKVAKGRGNIDTIVRLR